VEDDEVTFRFRAKNRRLVRRTVRNATLARGVFELLELPVSPLVVSAYRSGSTIEDFRSTGTRPRRLSSD